MELPLLPFGAEGAKAFSFAADVLQAAHWQLVHLEPAASCCEHAPAPDRRTADGGPAAVTR